MLDKFKNNSTTEKLLLAVILTGLGALFLWFLMQSEGFVGDADSATHYRFARYSWKYPEYFLDHWAKPVFTLLASPFAQFGHNGVSVFNLLSGLASVLFAWLIARKLGYTNRLLLPVMIFFTPIYASLVISGQVEVLFGLFIVAISWFSLDKKFMLAAILLSFAPFARTEGIFLIPVYALYFILEKQYRVIPYILTGSILYSFAGLFIYNDLFWLITKMPYWGKATEYGTGSLLHFFEAWHKIFSLVTGFFMVTGIAAILFAFTRKRDRQLLSEWFLILFPFVAYFAAHVLMWRLGIGRSLGLHRYMIAIVPVGALLALKGFNVFSSFLTFKMKSPVSATIFGVILAGVMIYIPFTLYRIPQKADVKSRVILDAAEFIRKEHLNDKKIYFYEPSFIVYLELDPQDSLQAKELVHDAAKPHYRIKEGEIVIWDGHFSPNQLGPVEVLKESPYFELVRTFEPSEPITFFDKPYSLSVFRRNGMKE